MTMPSTPGGHLERVVLHVLAGAAEDRVEQLLLGGELALATSGATLPTRMSPGRDARPDADDAVLVEVAQGALGDVRDVVA